VAVEAELKNDDNGCSRVSVRSCASTGSGQPPKSLRCRLRVGRPDRISATVGSPRMSVTTLQFLVFVFSGRVSRRLATRDRRVIAGDRLLQLSRSSSSPASCTRSSTARSGPWVTGRRRRHRHHPRPSSTSQAAFDAQAKRKASHESCPGPSMPA
jgi:hypothetical protein